MLLVSALTGIRAQQPSSETVIPRKQPALALIYPDYLAPTVRPFPPGSDVIVCAEMDEQWGYVGAKSRQRWLFTRMTGSGRRLFACSGGTGLKDERTSANDTRSN